MVSIIVEFIWFIEKSALYKDRYFKQPSGSVSQSLPIDLKWFMQTTLGVLCTLKHFYSTS